MTEPIVYPCLVLGAAALLGAALAATPTAQTTTPSTRGLASAPKPAPMPFDPKTAPGPSETLLLSRDDNNATGAVKRLGAIIERDFGGSGHWRTEFTATGEALRGGPSVEQWTADHSMTLAASAPTLVLEMYERASAEAFMTATNLSLTVALFARATA